MTIKEKNVKIALFMGATLCLRVDLYYPAEGNWYSGFENIPHPLHEDILDYHESWNSLMPVVDKIGKQGCIVDMWMSLGGGCKIMKPKASPSMISTYEEETLIEAVFNAVLQYINWYNSYNF